MSLSVSPSDANRRIEALRHRVGWICQTGRILVAGYALWILWLVISFWSDASLAARRFATLAGMEPAEISLATQLSGFLLSLTTWLLVAATCWTAWRLFTAYLDGRIFTFGSADLLRRTAMLGIAAVVFDIMIRPLMVWLVTGQVPDYAKASYYYFSPNDLALLIFLTSLFAIAHVFKVAAELADENAEIL